jgi:hypothetical protein
VRGYPLSTSQPYCRRCGALLGNTSLHKAFHESLDNLVRAVFAPNDTDVQWQERTESPEFRAFVDAKMNKRIAEIRVEEEVEKTIEHAAAALKKEGIVTLD